MIEDSELLNRFAREGDQTAFAVLVARHLDRVYNVALRQVGGDTHLAQDVAQTVFTALARKAGPLATHPALCAWLHRTAHFLATDLVRAEERRRAREYRAHAMHDLHTDSARDAEWEKLRPALDAVLADLPERDRAALALRFFENRAYADVGARLALSEDAARMRVDRALGKMRTLLARRGITCTASALGSVLAAPGLVAAPSGLASSITAAALAASAGTAVGVGASALVAIMSSTKIVTGLAVTIVVLALGIGAADTARQRSIAATQTAEDTAANATLNSEVLALEKRVRDRAVQRDSAPAVAAAPTFPTPSTAGDAKELGQKFLAEHPAVHQALIRTADAGIRFRFAGLFRELGLASTQIDAFLAIERPHAMSAGGPWGPGGAIIELRAGPPSTRQERDHALESLLGSEGMRRYRDYVATMTGRHQALTAASYLVFDDEPLTSDQIEELARSIQSHRIQNAPGATSQYAWPDVLEDVRDVLTPAQLQVIDFLHASDAYQTARISTRKELFP